MFGVQMSLPGLVVVGGLVVIGVVAVFIWAIREGGKS